MQKTRNQKLNKTNIKKLEATENNSLKKTQGPETGDPCFILSTHAHQPLPILTALTPVRAQSKTAGI